MTLTILPVTTQTDPGIHEPEQMPVNPPQVSPSVGPEEAEQMLLKWIDLNGNGRPEADEFFLVPKNN